MTDAREPYGRPTAIAIDDDLIFLRDEGLLLLARYRAISDAAKRKKVMAYIEMMLAEEAD